MENRSLLPICSLFNSSLKLSLTVKAKEQVCLLQSQIWEPTQLGVLALKNFLTQSLTLFFYSFKGKLVFGGALAITYLFPLSLSVANAFKLLNEEPGGSEKILLWLKSKCRNLARRSTTVGTSVNSFQDKSILSSSLKSNPSKAFWPRPTRPLFTMEISVIFTVLFLVAKVHSVT